MNKIKKILIFTLIFFSINNTFAIENKYTAFYEQCNILLDKSQEKNIAELWNNLCLFIKKQDKYLILSKQKNDFWLTLLNDKYINYLKKYYYRWEKINIKLSWREKIIENKLNFTIWKYSTLNENYEINFLEDDLLNQEKYDILKKSCKFNSYISNCNDKIKNSLIKRIDLVFKWKKLNKEILLHSNLIKLQKELGKINFIKNKILKIDQFYKKNKKDIYSDNIKFTIFYIYYKLDIYSKILENRIWDLEFKNFLVKNNIYYIDKKLVWNLFISQNNEFTFFYYWKKRVNTLKNSLSLFDEEELKNDPKISLNNIEYLKEKIREKYSAKYIKNTNNRLILITKNYLSRKKYLLFDSIKEKVFKINWEIEQVEKWKKWYYFISKNYSWNQFFELYNWKNIQTILETKKKYIIKNFELLIWKKVQINYILDWNILENEIIDISEY